MRGFVSGVFWGLVTSAVVFVVAALRLDDPGAAVVEGDDAEVEVVVEPSSEDGAEGGATVVATEPDAERTGGLGVSTGPQGTAGPFDDPDRDVPVAGDVEPPAEPGEPLAEEPEAVVVEEPADDAAEAPDAVAVEVEVEEAEPEPDGATVDDSDEGDVEVREDGTTVIERTVPVEPVEEDG